MAKRKGEDKDRGGEEPAPNPDKFTDTSWGHWEIIPGAGKPEEPEEPAKDADPGE